MSRKRPPEQSLDDILVGVDFQADDDDSARDSAVGRFSDGDSVFSTNTIDTAEVDDIDGPAIQHIRVYSAQDSTDGPPNIEANFPSDTENFADFIDAANDEEQDTEDPPILPNINNGEEPTSLTNEAAMGTGIEGALRYEDDIQGAHWNRNEDGIDGALRDEDGIASVPPPTLPAIDHQLYETGGDKYKPPKFRSIAHPFFSAKKAVLLSLDIETAGDAVGIVQLSAEISRVHLQPTGSSSTKDTATNITRDTNIFNAYINPGEEKADFWTEASRHVHGLHPSHPKILSANDMSAVWSDFCNWFDERMDPGERAILVAWNGANCDLKEIWKLTQAPGTVLSFPRQIQFFMDPYRVISTYTGCRLHPSKSKLDSLSLGVVWKHLFGGNLNGAHDSQVDAKAQTDIIVHEHFIPFVNRTQSIQEIENIFTARQQNEWKKTMEPLRPVHSP